MSEIAKRLRERRQNVWEQAKALADKATEENRAFTAEEQGSWDQLNEELDKLDTRIKAVLDGEKRSKDADEAMAALAGGGRGTEQRGGVVAPAGEKELADQFRRLAEGEIRSVTVGLPTAFERRQIMNGGVEQRSPILTGNAPMPTTFIGQLYRFLVDTSSIRQANPTVYTTSSGEALTIPRSTAEGSASWFAEGAQVTESNPSLSSVTLNAYKVGKTIYVSNELLQDTGFDLLGFLAEHAGRNIGIAVDTGYVAGAGSGSNQPSGLIGSATTAVTLPVGSVTSFPATTSTTNPADLLIDLYHSVIPQYRVRASWLFHDATIKQVRKFKDTTGQYLWQPALVAGQPDTLLGKPVYADPNVPVMAASAKFGAFGDFSGYAIRDVSPMRFDRSDDFKFDTDVVSFRALYRTDGKQVDTNAIKLIANPAT